MFDYPTDTTDDDTARCRDCHQRFHEDVLVALDDGWYCPRCYQRLVSGGVDIHWLLIVLGIVAAVGTYAVVSAIVTFL